MNEERHLEPSSSRHSTIQPRSTLEVPYNSLGHTAIAVHGSSAVDVILKSDRAAKASIWSPNRTIHAVLVLIVARVDWVLLIENSQDHAVEVEYTVTTAR